MLTKKGLRALFQPETMPGTMEMPRHPMIYAKKLASFAMPGDFFLSVTMDRLRKASCAEEHSPIQGECGGEEAWYEYRF